MIPQLYEHQAKLENDIYDVWAQGAHNVMPVLPTGGGKTVVMSAIVRKSNTPTCVMAHRQELVSQISCTLNKNEVRHKIIAPKEVVRRIVAQHTANCGRSFYDPSARSAVAGVDTLLARESAYRGFFNTVGLWVMDEGHHILADNKWGRATRLFPQTARGLGFTATPLRADGKGLGRHHDGVMDALVEGPSLQELIHKGFLSGYKIYAPPSDLDTSDVNVTASGDLNQQQLSVATKRSHILGDIVEHYLRLAPGKRGLTFVPSIEIAVEVAKKFCAAGVPAVAISAKSSESERNAALRGLANGGILQVVNVDLLGEGFDAPAVEVVSLARKTYSFALFAQQVGRVLRVMEGKSHAIIIDHVGNVMHHASVRTNPWTGKTIIDLCDKEWTLDRREKRKASAGEATVKVKTCLSCLGVYEAFQPVCPYCGEPPVYTARTAPEMVDGDLVELDPEALEGLMREKSRIDSDPNAVRDKMLYAGAPQIAAYGAAKQHRLRQQGQAVLRDSISWWAGAHRHIGRSDREIYRRFYLTFGVDMLTAQTLGPKEADELNYKILVDTHVNMVNTAPTLR